MSAELSSLYQEVILDHATHPRNFGVMANPDRSAEGNNPLCGDHVTVYLKIDAGKITDVRFAGEGCAICKSSTSIMTELIADKSTVEAEQLFHAFHAMLTGQADRGEDTGLPDKLAIFSGVCEFPMRVKCATLPWHTLHAALAGDDKTVTTE